MNISMVNQSEEWWEEKRERERDGANTLVCVCVCVHFNGNYMRFFGLSTHRFWIRSHVPLCCLINTLFPVAVCILAFNGNGFSFFRFVLMRWTFWNYCEWKKRFIDFYRGLANAEWNVEISIIKDSEIGCSEFRKESMATLSKTQSPNFTIFQRNCTSWWMQIDLKANHLLISCCSPFGMDLN